MTGRDLYKTLNYSGMERGARKLAAAKKLAPIESIALMDGLEVCDLIMCEYELVMAESEKVLLIPKNKLDMFNEISVFLKR